MLLSILKHFCFQRLYFYVCDINDEFTESTFSRFRLDNEVSQQNNRKSCSVIHYFQFMTKFLVGNGNGTMCLYKYFHLLVYVVKRDFPGGV